MPPSDCVGIPIRDTYLRAGNNRRTGLFQYACQPGLDSETASFLANSLTITLLHWLYSIALKQRLVNQEIGSNLHPLFGYPSPGRRSTQVVERPSAGQPLAGRRERTYVSAPNITWADTSVCPYLSRHFGAYREPHWGTAILGITYGEWYTFILTSLSPTEYIVFFRAFRAFRGNNRPPLAKLDSTLPIF